MHLELTSFDIKFTNPLYHDLKADNGDSIDVMNKAPVCIFDGGRTSVMRAQASL